MSKETIQKRARKLLSDLCLLPIRKGQDAEIALIVAALTPPWQPIESAPKDGRTHILLWSRGELLIGLRPVGCPDDAAADLFGIACYPTHWMPQPEAPEAA